MRINTKHQEKLYFEDLEIGDVFYHKYLQKICIKIDNVFDEYENCLNTVYLRNGELYLTDDNDEVILCDAELSVKY